MYLGVQEKLSHTTFPGFELRLQCLKQNDEAWHEMKVYNIQDVDTLEQVYMRLRTWIKNPPSHGVYTDEKVCTNCGGKHLHKRGTYSNNISNFKRFKCLECGGGSRARKKSRKKEDDKAS